MIRLIREIKRFADECKTDNVTAYAAEAAYFTLMSLIPFMLFFGALLKYTPVTLDFLEKEIILVMPDYVEDFLVGIVQETYESSAGILSVSAVVAIWSAAKGIQYLTDGLNKMYNLKETRNWLVMRIWAIFYTFIMVFSIVLALVLLIFGKTLHQWLLQYVPAVAGLTQILLRLKSLIGIGTLTVVFLFFYWALPNKRAAIEKRITFLGQLPGAFLSSLAWYVFSMGVSIYVNIFHGFSSYGSLTTIVLIMFWLYTCMYILLVCAEINHQYSEKIIRTLREHVRSNIRYRRLHKKTK